MAMAHKLRLHEPEMEMSRVTEVDLSEVACTHATSPEREREREGRVAALTDRQTVQWTAR